VFEFPPGQEVLFLSEGKLNNPRKTWKVAKIETLAPKLLDPSLFKSVFQTQISAGKTSMCMCFMTTDNMKAVLSQASLRNFKRGGFCKETLNVQNNIGSIPF
jgi:hypothetical protein